MPERPKLVSSVNVTGFSFSQFENDHLRTLRIELDPRGIPVAHQSY